jgi:pilus assembly protein Flp/PilA
MISAIAVPSFMPFLPKDRPIVTLGHCSGMIFFGKPLHALHQVRGRFFPDHAPGRRGTGIGRAVKRASMPAAEALICIPAPRQGWTSGIPAVRIYAFFSLFLNGRESIPTLDCPPGTALAESLETGRRQEFGMRKLVARFLADQSGATAIEYCIIAAGISIVIVTVVQGMGTNLNTKFTSISSSLK